MSANYAITAHLDNGMYVLSDAKRPLRASSEESRVKIEAIEKELITLPQVDLPLEHFFAKGIYVRKIFMPKGTVATGRIHKHSGITVMLSGDLSILTEDGMKRITGPCVYEHKAGVKRALYMHEDSVVLTIHGTDKTDMSDLREELTAETNDEYISFVRAQLSIGEES